MCCELFAKSKIYCLIKSFGHILTSHKNMPHPHPQETSSDDVDHYYDIRWNIFLNIFLYVA